MSSQSRQLLKMGSIFLFFLVPLLVCLLGLVAGLTGLVLVENPWIDWGGGPIAPYGFGLVLTGLGAALFGREALDALQEWLAMRRRRRKYGQNQKSRKPPVDSN